MLLVRPHLETYAPIWLPHLKGFKEQLEKVQRRAVRWTCGAKWDRKWMLHHEDCCSRLNLPTIEQWLSCCQIYKIVKNQDCFRFSDYFTFNSSFTRTESFRLNVLPCRINSYRYSVNAPFMWNDLSPVFITNSSSLLIFKHELKCSILNIWLFLLSLQAIIYLDYTCLFVYMFTCVILAWICNSMRSIGIVFHAFIESC